MVVPPSFIYETRWEDGSYILGKNPNAQFNGKPLDPKRKYGVKIGVPVNHYRRMVQIFNKTGMDGVVEYMNSFSPKNQAVNENHPN
jgi:hypothetical protein